MFQLLKQTLKDFSDDECPSACWYASRIASLDTRIAGRAPHCGQLAARR